MDPSCQRLLPFRAVRRAAGAFGLVVSLGAGACGAPPGPPSMEGRESPEIALSPTARLDAAPTVLRVHITGIDAEPEALLLFTEALGSYHAARIRSGELPTTLGPRRVVVRAWREGSGLALAPSVALAPGTTYSVAALGVGLVGTFATAKPAPSAFAARIWPPASVPRGAVWVYCGSLARPPTKAGVSLDPDGVAATVTPGADSAGIGAERCVRLSVVRPLSGKVAIPPVEVDGTALDPAPLVVSDGPPAEPASCAEREIPFGAVCAEVADDRAYVRAGKFAALVALRVGGTEYVESLKEGEGFTVPDLPPASAVAVEGSTTDPAGNETKAALAWQTGAPRAHVVIDEVLANPLGPEPASEWIELYNDGRTAVSLEGFTLADDGGPFALPPAVLDPGAFALVVGEGFSLSSTTDVPVAAGTLILRVPRLGRGGLSNAGEALRLLDGAGALVSSFPPLPATKAGVSWARRDPSLLDDAPDAFSPGAPPGASPGATNP